MNKQGNMMNSQQITENIRNTDYHHGTFNVTKVRLERTFLKGCRNSDT